MLYGIYIMLFIVLGIQVYILLPKEYKQQKEIKHTVPENINALFNNFKHNKDKETEVNSFVEGLNNLMNYDGEPQRGYDD